MLSASQIPRKQAGRASVSQQPSQPASQFPAAPTNPPPPPTNHHQLNRNLHHSAPRNKQTNRSQKIIIRYAMNHLLLSSLLERDPNRPMRCFVALRWSVRSFVASLRANARASKVYRHFDPHHPSLRARAARTPPSTAPPPSPQLLDL